MNFNEFKDIIKDFEYPCFGIKDISTFNCITFAFYICDKSDPINSRLFLTAIRMTKNEKEFFKRLDNDGCKSFGKRLRNAKLKYLKYLDKYCGSYYNDFCNFGDLKGYKIWSV